MNILEVRNLYKTYGTGETTVHALQNINLSIQTGEVVAIVGPSGSGKSTLMHLIGGVDLPSNGSVMVQDTDIYKLNQSKLAIFRRRHVGLIYQFYNLIPTLTVEENILLPCLLDGRKAPKEKLEDILAATGLSKRRGHLPNQLSGGQQQRVSIGRALINDPALVLADEPTGNLDSVMSAEIMELLLYANRRY
ncbi:MAG: ABC transporter ATP-binding protein, partial [Coriobacteriales bacterium]|nr:ABC transporter ATP-binding protein [Coriobacteriales bacterium]